MANGKFVAYYRVSTAQQGKSGLGLEAQQVTVQDYLNGGKWKMVGEFTEVESGKRKDRPELLKALSLCRLHNATLLIAKLDRLARNVLFTATLVESSVKFTAVDFPDANNLTIHILAAVAEHEATMISSRTKAALTAAKARGVVLGCRNTKIAAFAIQGAEASAARRGADVARRSADVLPVIREIQESLRQAVAGDGKASLRLTAAMLNERKIPASRGGEWSAVQVQRVLARA